MNKLSIISLLLLVTCTNLNAQWFWWQGEPTPLTNDTVSDNINPHLFYNGTSFYMAWEKPVDSLSTAIWFRDITSQTPDVEILYTPGVHYKNPKILGNWYSPDFYLFYETNEAGNDDIYYLYNEGLGSFSDPMVFADSNLDENSFYPDHEVNYGRGGPGMVWISDQSVYYANLQSDQFTDPILIDSGNCYNPLISNHSSHIVWEKVDSSFRYLAYTAHWNTTGWQAPDTAFYGSNCTNLKADKIDRGMIIFSFQADTVWKIGIGNSNGYGPFYEVDTLDLIRETPFAPAITTYWIPLNNLDWWYDGFISFPFPDSNSMEIYMNEDPWNSQYSNFSQLGTECRNPDFFCSPFPYDPYCEGIYLVWEAFVNGHWQLYYALEMQQCYGSIDENDADSKFIKVKPNPFTSKTTIEFTLTDQELVIADIFDQQGRNVAKIADNIFDPGTHQLRWNASSLPSGVYIVKMMVGERVYTSKIIKSP